MVGRAVATIVFRESRLESRLNFVRIIYTPDPTLRGIHRASVLGIQSPFDCAGEHVAHRPSRMHHGRVSTSIFVELALRSLWLRQLAQSPQTLSVSSPSPWTSLGNVRVLVACSWVVRDKAWSLVSVPVRELDSLRVFKIVSERLRTESGVSWACEERRRRKGHRQALGVSVVGVQKKGAHGEGSGRTSRGQA